MEALAFIFFIAIFLIPFGYLIYIKSSISNYIGQQEETNNQIKKTLNDKKFNQSQTFYLDDCITYNQENSCKKFISIDKNENKICLVDYSTKKTYISNLNDIVNYTVYENGGNFETIGAYGSILFG